MVDLTLQIFFDNAEVMKKMMMKKMMKKMQMKKGKMMKKEGAFCETMAKKSMPKSVMMLMKTAMDILGQQDMDENEIMDGDEMMMEEGDMMTEE